MINGWWIGLQTRVKILISALGTAIAVLVGWNTLDSAWNEAELPVPATRGYVIQKIGEVESKIAGPIKDLQIATVEARLRDLDYREGRIRGELLTRQKELAEIASGPARDIIQNRLLELEVEKRRVTTDREQLEKDLRKLKK